MATQSFSSPLSAIIAFSQARQQLATEERVTQALAALNFLFQQGKEGEASVEVLLEELHCWLQREAEQWIGTISPQTPLPCLEGQLVAEWADARYNAMMRQFAVACEQRDEPRARFWQCVMDTTFPTSAHASRAVYRMLFPQVVVDILP